MARTKGKPKFTSVVAVKVTPALVRKLQKMAKLTHTTTSHVIRELIRNASIEGEGDAA